MNSYERRLASLTRLECLVRMEIENTKDMRKKEVYRKRHEKIIRELNDCLKYVQIES